MNLVVSRKGTTYEQWLSLEKTFSSSTQSRIINLHSQLQTLRKEGFSITNNVAKIRTIAYHLATIGEPIFE